MDGSAFDELRDLGRSLGLTEASAQAFAVGRDGSEAGARRAFAEAGGGEADLTAATNAAVAAEVDVLGRTAAQAASHVSTLAREASARRGAAYASQFVTEYARALRGGA